MIWPLAGVTVTSFLTRRSSNPLNPHPLPQHFRDDDAAVGLLLVFEKGDHGSRDRDGDDGDAVERVDEVHSLSRQPTTRIATPSAVPSDHR